MGKLIKLENGGNANLDEITKIASEEEELRQIEYATIQLVDYMNELNKEIILGKTNKLSPLEIERLKYESNNILFEFQHKKALLDGRKVDMEVQERLNKDSFDDMSKNYKSVMDGAALAIKDVLKVGILESEDMIAKLLPVLKRYGDKSFKMDRFSKLWDYLMAKKCLNKIKELSDVKIEAE